MFSEEEAEVLRTLMIDLEGAFKHHKASRAIYATKNAYMRAKFNINQIETHRSRTASKKLEREK